MDDTSKKMLERTRDTLNRHLEDLNDEVDSNGGRISDPCVLDGISTALRSLTCINGLMSESNGNGQSENVKSTVKTVNNTHSVLDK